MIPGYLGAVIQTHFYTRLADFDNRLNHLEEKDRVRETKIRAIFRYLEDIELHLEEQKTSLRVLDEEIEKNSVYLNRASIKYKQLTKKLEYLSTLTVTLRNRVIGRLNNLDTQVDGLSKSMQKLSINK